MARIRTTLIFALVALAVAPAAALAKPNAQPLRDVAPLGGKFKDRVLAGSSRIARASISGNWHTYKVADGLVLSAAISDGYANRLSTSVAQTYADFLDSQIGRASCRERV